MRYIRDRMIEFRDRMEPVLKELNLRTRMQTNEAGIEVYFVSRSRKVDPFLSHSSVSIIFEDREETGLKEASWERAYLAVEQHEPRSLGDTGWFHRRWWGSVYLDLPADPEEMWQFIERNFREQPFIFMEPVPPMEIENEHLVDAFYAIDGVREDDRIEGLNIDRLSTDEGVVESLVFEDVNGREVRLEFHRTGEKGRAFVDGEPSGTFDVYSEKRVASLASALYTGHDAYAEYFLRK